MTEIDAIKARHSVRKYLNKAIEQEKIDKLIIYSTSPVMKVVGEVEVLDKLEKIIKERRSQSNNISTVDKDLEEQDRLEALEKMNKEVEEAINNDEIKKTEEEVKGVSKEEDADVKKLREEEELKSQLEEMTKNLHNEMLIQNNLNK